MRKGAAFTFNAPGPLTPRRPIPVRPGAPVKRRYPGYVDFEADRNPGSSKRLFRSDPQLMEE